MSLVDVAELEGVAVAGATARVLVVHDHQLVAHELRIVVREAPAGRVAVVGWATNHDLDAAVRSLRPSIALVCLSSSQDDRLGAVRRLKAAWPHLSLVVQCSPQEATFAVACLCAGVDAVVSTDVEPSALVAALVTVTEGMNVIPSWLRPSVAGPTTLPPGLNDEERELWRLITHGFANDAIAHALHLSNRTLKRRICRLLCTLTVANRVEAAALGGRLGLLDDRTNNKGDSDAVLH